ncbi:MAG: Panacea domain-containing protein [Patescibacteria group bacterium]
MALAVNKYENAILFLCKRQGGSLRGKKKLAKLLYFLDFDRYEFKESTKSLTGDTYKHLPLGPVPDHYMQIVAKLEKKGALSRKEIEGTNGYAPTEVFVCNQEPDLSVFDKDELYILKRASSLYGGLNGTQLEKLSHAEAPYLATEPYELIDYQLAFYRGSEFADAVS